MAAEEEGDVLLNAGVRGRISRRARAVLLAATLATGIGGAASPPAATAQAPAEPPRTSAPVLRTSDLLWAGGLAAGALLLAPSDAEIADAARGANLQDSPWLSVPADGLRLLGFPGPILATGGLFLVGHLTDRPALADVGLHAGEAVGIAAVLTVAAKSIAGRARPYNEGAYPGDFELGRGWLDDRYQSFPSGHATAAFAAASALTEEIGHHWPAARARAGVALYGTAALIAASRVYHDVHWASDAAAGAALGTLVGGAVVRLAHTYPGNRLDRIFLGSDVTPLPGGMAVRLVFVAPF